MGPDRIRLVAGELQLELSSRSQTLYFHGESMRPFLGEGDEVVVDPVAYEDIRMGDVITYRFEDKFPTRRVVGKGRDGIHLWCENWPERRFWTPKEDLLGRAVARGRNGVWITHQDSEWRAARRSALLAYWRRELFPYLAGLPSRALAKAGRMVRRERAS